LASEQNDSWRFIVIVRVRQFVDYLFCVGYGIIGLQILLDLAGAQNDSGFKRFLNKVTYPLLGPFEGIFPDPVFHNHFHIRISYCVALLVYSLIHLAVYYFFRLVQPKRQLL
jgi:uncharacterized protein YggT (Ycf19 family)